MLGGKLVSILSIFLILFSVAAVAADRPVSVEVSARNPIIRTNPCQVSEFTFFVTNPSSQPESYQFAATGLEQYTTLSTDFIVLGPRETTQVDLFVNPACEIYGQQQLTFQALAEGSKYLAEANVVLDIAQAYNYDVSVPFQSTICNLKKSTIPVTIQNEVPFANEYEMKLRGPSWLSGESSVLAVPYETVSTNLVAEPIHPGTYQYDVFTHSVRGDVLKAGTQNITVEDCYDAELNIGQPSDILIAGHSQKYTTTITNKGTKADSFSFELASPDWVSGNLQRITLQPGESKNFELSAQVPVNMSGTYVIILQATSQETGIAYQDKLTARVTSPEDAYNLAISEKHTRVLYGEDAVAILFKNKGLLPATYSLTVQGPAFAKLESNTITVQPGEQQVVALDTNAQEKDPVADYETIVTATVPNENIGFTNTFNLALRPITLTQEIQGFVIAYWPFITAGAVLLIVIVALIAFRKRIGRRFREMKLRKQEEARLRTQLKEERRAQKLAKRLLRESLKKPRNWKKTFLGLFLVLIAILLIGGAVAGTLGYGPFVQEFFKQQPQLFQSMVKVDTTGLEAFGNTVIIRGETTIVPILVKNNFNDSVVFDVQTDASWIKTDTKRITLKPGQEDTVRLTVTPDDTAAGVYKVSVSANLERDNKIFKEDVTLNIKRRNLVQEALYYVPYVVGGVIVLIIALILLRKAKKRKAKEIEDRLASKIQRKISLVFPKKK